MKIVFMGTPDFAVASLAALLEAGEDVVAVVTAPDKPSGRGQKTTPSPVKTYALDHKLPVLQPIKLKDPAFLSSLKAFDADLQVVVAFRMLPEVVWHMPPQGTINLHASLLPQYRGAAPINHALINGETETGVTTFFISHEIDTGNLLFSKNIPISPDDDAGTLHDKLMVDGASLLVDTVKAIKRGDYVEKPQPLQQVALKPAPKIFKEDCLIHWNQPVRVVYNFIRGLSPYPAAYTNFHGQILKIYKSIPEIKTPRETPGTILSDQKTFLKFTCTDGYIEVRELQLQGKKRMGISDFLRGYRWVS